MSATSRSWYWEKIESLLSQYTQNGYRVTPSADFEEIDQLPAKLRGLEPDFIAQRESETVAILVKSFANSKNLGDIGLEEPDPPGKYRVDLLWVGASPIDIDSDDPQRLVQHAEFVRHTDEAAGILLAWLALESALALVAASSGIDTSERDVSTQAAKLRSHGAISEDDLNDIELLADVRAQLIHDWDRVGKTDPGFFNEICHYATKFSHPGYASPDYMIDWIENSLSHSPGTPDHRDDRRLRHHFSRLVDTAFPDAPQESKDEVVFRLLNDPLKSD